MVVAGERGELAAGAPVGIAAARESLIQFAPPAISLARAFAASLTPLCGSRKRPSKSPKHPSTWPMPFSRVSK